jgi:hypothetical protein
VKSILVSQVSAPSICAFYAAALDVSNVTATGSNALALVAPGPIVLRGSIDVAARSRIQGSLNAGPGSVTLGACIGQYTDATSNGAGGGGGNATPGSDGLSTASIPVHRAGGLAQTGFEPLIGGCQGGEPFYGGGGGGAIQIDSATAIHMLQSGFLALGAAGGESGYGGGSGGNVVLEAPEIELSGGVAANGGGGGLGGTTCGGPGANATNDEVPAPGAVQSCSSGNGGAGGTRLTAPTLGVAVIVDGGGASGGGGAVGRILIRTKDGTFIGPGSIFSIVQTTDTLVKH